MDKRGPKIGDAASLWNFTPSPGWTKEESLILKLCLMKFGIGQWIQIQATGLLPGKLIQQLNGATQRLLGQQSLAAFSGLRLDVDRVRADNAARTDARRKNGLIIWGGPNPTKAMRLQWQQEARDKYSLTQEQQREVEAAFEAMAAAAAAAAVPPQGAEGASAGGTAAVGPAAAAGLATMAAAAAHEGLPSDILGCAVEQLSLGQKQLLLCALHQRLQQVLGDAVQRLPHLTQLVSYQQQQQQQQQEGSSGDGSSSWIVAGLPGAAAGTSSAAGTGVSSGSAVAAAAVAAAAGFDSDASKQAGSQVRQAGTAAARAGGQQPGTGRSKGSKANSGNSSRKAPAGGGTKKRSRSKAAAAAADEDDDDAEAAFLRRQQQQQRRRTPAGRSAGGGGGGGSGLFADMLRAALEAGVAQLVDMGYSRSKALDALRECDYDVEAAVEFLTAACC